MTIYSDVLTHTDLMQAAEFVGVYVANADLAHGRRRRFERVTLRATGRRSRHPSWDEHGWWMAVLFERDPQARIVTGSLDYNGVDDFNNQTEGKYQIVIEDRG